MFVGILCATLRESERQRVQTAPRRHRLDDTRSRNVVRGDPLIYSAHYWRACVQRCGKPERQRAHARSVNPARLLRGLDDVMETTSADWLALTNRARAPSAVPADESGTYA